MTSCIDMFGLRVVWTERYEEMEALILKKKDEIDIAIEWQVREGLFPVLGIFEKHDIQTPVLLSLNWNRLLPPKFEELGFAGTLKVPWEIDELRQKFYAVLPDKKKEILKRSLLW